MRSGPPDSLDRLVASNFANLAADLVLSDEAGRLVAIRGGRYKTTPIETLGEGTKRVNVARFYDTEQYRANIVGVMDLPMFLC
jgi:6-phosphofructokinase 1